MSHVFVTALMEELCGENIVLSTSTNRKQATFPQLRVSDSITFLEDSDCNETHSNTFIAHG